jgi:hypothetical protein
MAEGSELPFDDETDKANLTQAKRLAEVTTEAHRKVEKRKKRGAVKVEDRQNIAAAKKSLKKAASRSAKKTTAQARTKKLANVKSSR